MGGGGAGGVEAHNSYAVGSNVGVLVPEKLRLMNAQPFACSAPATVGTRVVPLKVTKGKHKLRAMVTMMRLVAETITPMYAPEKDELGLQLNAIYRVSGDGWEAGCAGPPRAVRVRRSLGRRFA